MRWILSLAVVVFALSLLAAAVLHTPRPDRTGDVEPLIHEQLPDRFPSPRIGFSLNVYHTDHLARYLDAIDQMADLGINHLQIVTPMFQEYGGSAEVELLRGPGRGPTPEELVVLLRYAHDRGLTTGLMPQVNFTRPRGTEWRGKLRPDDWQRWWASYERAIDTFVDIAVAADVDVFCVGCELITTQGPDRLDDWQSLITHCRDRYDGLLTYSTTWDSYDDVQFWPQLDLVGVSGYWDMTTRARNPQHPTDAEIDARWREIREPLLTFARRHDRPVFITELGYPSLPWALSKPWNYVNPRDTPAKPYPAAQARGYASFLRNWNDLLRRPDEMNRDDAPPLFFGVTFYAWDPYRSDPEAAAADTGYGIRGKPAEAVLRAWLQKDAPRPK